MITLSKSNSQILFISVFLISSLFSCSDNSKSINKTFKVLDESIAQAWQRVERNNELIYDSFEDKLIDSATSQKARIWYPKVLLVQKLSRDLKNYIERLRGESEKVGKLTEERVSELYDRLKRYKAQVFNIDPGIKAEFDTTFFLSNGKFDLLQNDKKFTTAFFDHLPTEGVLSVLNMLKGKVTDVENRLILFFNAKTTNHPVHEWFSAIVGQNYSHVKAGGKIEITAGVGTFSHRFEPEIIINGRKILLNEKRLAVHKFSASAKPGKYYVPVEISYFDEHGKKLIIAKTVEYNVVE